MKIRSKTIAGITISVICAIIGGFILWHGIDKTYQGINEEKQISIVGTSANYTIVHYIVDKLIPAQELPATLVRSIDVLFVDTPYFPHDFVNYTAVAFVNDKDNVPLIVVVAISSEDDTFNQITPDQVPFVIDEERKANHVIELHSNTNPPYYIEQGNLTFASEQHITLHAFLFTKNNGIIEFDSMPSGVYINPDVAKIQYQTNEAILQQIEQSKQAVKSQSATNDIVEGLTWVIVAWIPLGVTTDLLLRLYFDEKKKERVELD